MSLYIGKDNSNSTILHITSGTEEISALKGGPKQTTVFHSDLRYLSYQVYSPVYTSFIPDTYASSTSYYVGGLVVLMPQEFYDSFNTYTTRLYVILLDDSDAGLNIYHMPIGNRDTRYNPPQCAWFSFHPSASTNDGLYSGETQYPSNSNKYGFINTKVNTSNVKILLTNYSDTDVLFNYKLNNNINITGDSLSIGGIDISSYPYITKSIVNTIDTTITLNGETYQLCNHNSSGSFSLSSNPNIELKVGAKVIANSLYPNNLLSSYYSSLTYYDLVVGNTVPISVSGLKNKDLLLLSYTIAYIVSTGQRLYTTYILSYTEGKVMPIVRTKTTSVDLVCSGGVVYIRFNAFWTSSYSNFIGIKYRLFN